MPALRHLLSTFAFATFPLLAAPASAAILTWPGTAPCAGTLQACIDAAADGDRIEIATDTPITSNLMISSQSLTLTAADGHRPTFQNAHINIIGSSSHSGDLTVRLSRLRIESGYVDATQFGSGTANIDLRELEVSAEAGHSAIRIGAFAGTTAATLYHNRITGGSTEAAWSGLISLGAVDGATLDADVYYNQVTRTLESDAQGMGISSSFIGTGTSGTIKLHANTVRGNYPIASVMLREGSADNPGAANYDARLYNNVVIGSGQGDGDGIRLGVTSGQIEAQLINNTVQRVRNAFMAGNMVPGRTGGVISGMLHNNILIGEHAVSVSPPEIASTMVNSHNLVNGDIFGMTMGSGTVNAPALLNSQIDARPSENSPAIDAGDNASLGWGLIFNGIPNTDADGLRRFKKKTPSTAGADRVDIGAYEYGDFSFSHTVTSDNRSGYITSLYHPAILNQGNANLFATGYFDGVFAGQPIGSWEFSGSWSLYNKDSTDNMPLGARYNVFAAGAGSGVLRHVTSASNITGGFSKLPLADNPDLIVLALQNYNTGSVPNPRKTGVLYFAIGGSGSWSVGNLDSTQAMPEGVGFSIYAQPSSPNAFRVTATAGNLTSGMSLKLDHPLLNGNPCAQPVITRMFTANDGSDFDMEYLDGIDRWRIYDYNGMALGSQFNVLVNPAQAETCGGAIFFDGFE